MPKIYEYLGIIFFFYSNEHKPIHIHVKYGKEKMYIKIYTDENRNITKVVYDYEKTDFRGKIRDIKKFISIFGSDIINKWEIFFSNKKVTPTIINKKL